MAPHNGRQVHTPSCRRRCGCRTRLALTVLLAACCTRLVSAAGNGTKARGRVGEAPVLVLDDGPRNRTQGPSAVTGELRQMIPSLTDADPLARFPPPRAPTQAVCADGSDAYFYFRKGYNAANFLARPPWIAVYVGVADSRSIAVFLQGGPICYDRESCLTQNITAWRVMTSHYDGAKIFLSGLFSTDSLGHVNDFADANVAYLQYCSGDGYLGDTEVDGFQFRGQRIFNALINSLIKDHGLGGGANGRVLLAGCSPGTIVHIDSIKTLITGMGLHAENTQVYGLFDSVLWVDVDPMPGSGVPPLTQVTSLAATYFNASALYGEQCSAQYGGDNTDAGPAAAAGNETDSSAALAPAGDGWKCLFPQYRLPFVQAPFLLNAPQFDRAQLNYYLGDGKVDTPAKQAFADSFQQTTLSVINSLFGIASNGKPSSAAPTLTAASGKVSGLYSSACFMHCQTLSAAFWNVKIAEGAPVPAPAPGKRSRQRIPPVASLAEMVREFYSQGRRKIRWVQDCSGWRCGQCSAHGVPGSPTAERLEDLREQRQQESVVERMAGPLVVIMLLLVFCGGCCVACTTSEGRKGRRRRGGVDASPTSSAEDTPLVPAAWRIAFPATSKMYANLAAEALRKDEEASRAL